MSKQKVEVEGMHCNGCANSVKTKFEALSGVSQVDVDLDTHQVLVDSERELSQKELMQSLEETTYEVVNVTNV